MPVFKSFIDYAASRGIYPKQRKEKPFVCRKCGGEMRHIPGTNVYLCENNIEHVMPETGEKFTVPCGNRVFTKYAI